MNRAEALERISAVAAEQGGFVSAKQAAAQGVPTALLSRLAAGGILRRLRRGVYGAALGRASSADEDLIAAWLSLEGAVMPWERVQPRAVISHASAAAVRSLGTIIPALPELTTRRQAGHRDGIVTHTAPFDEGDWDWLDLSDVRVPVTTPARTIVDLWLAREETEYLEQAIAQSYSGPAEAFDDLLAALRRRRPRVGPDLERALRRLADA